MNEDIKQENSNKNPVINSTQRDYMAGEVSKDLTARILLPEEITRAHEEGIIHFHDADYFAQKEHNCDLINLEDMLQNGTVTSMAGRRLRCRIWHRLWKSAGRKSARLLSRSGNPAGTAWTRQ